MDNKIVLNSIELKKNRVEYNYTICGKWKRYFMNNKFYIEYNEGIENIPKSILVIPFLGTILPLSWVFDAEIIIDEIDEEFYNCIHNVKEGYKNMYPMIKFNGKLTAKNLKNNNYQKNDYNIVFFSGGIDAYSTLVTHIKEKLILVTLWGADIKTKEEQNWNIIENGIKEEANKNNKKSMIVKTSFREVLNHKNLDRYINPKAGDKWWHGFQHGIGIITHAAPICFMYKINNIYIASSFTTGDHETCASDPTIDNNIRIASATVIHDGYELARGDKIENIKNYIEKNKKMIKLRVCLTKGAVENCCSCEKCYRTIMECLVRGLDPNLVGFKCNEQTYKNIYSDFKTKITVRTTVEWKRIQKSYLDNYNKFKDDKRVNWIFNFDFEKNNKNFLKTVWRYKNKIKRRIKKLKCKCKKEKS